MVVSDEEREEIFTQGVMVGRAFSILIQEGYSYQEAIKTLEDGVKISLI